MTGLSVSPHRRCNQDIGGGSAAPAFARWLSLAAAPTFAVMALVSTVSGGQADMLCMQNTSPLSGMTMMYGLMSAFHMAPWLRLIGGA
jgi:hypothetical protein